jgi:hypothetical protein
MRVVTTVTIDFVTVVAFFAAVWAKFPETDLAQNIPIPEQGALTRVTHRFVNIGRCVLRSSIHSCDQVCCNGDCHNRSFSSCGMTPMTLFYLGGKLI